VGQRLLAPGLGVARFFDMTNEHPATENGEKQRGNALTKRKHGSDVA
jgi:hypothetical protein